jgi:hypothetical protein
MMRALGGIAVTALFSTIVFGQSGSATPSFDVADVHVRPVMFHFSADAMITLRVRRN